MPPAPPSLAGKKILVMGLGRFGGGVGVTKWLAHQGALVTVTDAAPADQLADSIQALDGFPKNALTFKLGGHDLADFLAADLLVINPAVDKARSHHVQQALAQGIPYTTEINLFLERCPALTIGITGSVGKSTTTTLIYEALNAALAANTPASPRAFLGGNIGRSLLLDLPSIRPHDLVVLELSSFMLEDTPSIAWSPNIAVVTNLFPNHLDRHDTLDNYAAAKQNILTFQHPKDVAILNHDHDLVAGWAPLAKGQVLTFTTRHAAKLPLVLPGDHNQSNARAALAVLDALETRRVPFNRAAALEAITHFPGLSHRLQLVHTLPLSDNRPLRFYNDSKATTPDASLTALAAFEPRTAIFLVGGYDKHIDMTAFETLLAQSAGGVIGIGQTGQALIDHIRAANVPHPLPADRLAYAGTLQAALPLARDWALATASLTAVVLSPASASWGQFTNYEQRGELFIDLSRNLSKKPK